MDSNVHQPATIRSVSESTLERKPVPILMYHSISSQASARFKEFTVSPSLFAEHVSYFVQRRYTPLTVTQFVRCMNNPASWPEHPIVLTFDDGFADFVADAFPILKHNGFSATLYVTTAYIGKTSRWLRREAETERPMLSWDELHEISVNGIECGAHAHNHLQLDVLSSTDAQYEITRCKDLLGEHLGINIESFAYPFGFYNENTRRLVCAAGYTSACAVKFTFSSSVDDPFALARLKISSDMSTSKLDDLLNGALSPITVAFKRSRTMMWQFIRCSAAQLSRLAHGHVSIK